MVIFNGYVKLPEGIPFLLLYKLVPKEINTFGIIRTTCKYSFAKLGVHDGLWHFVSHMWMLYTTSFLASYWVIGGVFICCMQLTGKFRYCCLEFKMCVGGIVKPSWLMTFIQSEWHHIPKCVAFGDEFLIGGCFCLVSGRWMPMPHEQPAAGKERGPVSWWLEGVALLNIIKYLGDCPRVNVCIDAEQQPSHL